MLNYTTSYSRIYRRDENPNQDNRPVTQDLPIRKPEWEGSVQLPSRTCLGGSAVPTDLSVVENGIWDSSLFVCSFFSRVTDWCCGGQRIVLLCGAVWVWARHVCAAVRADGEMLLIVWLNEVRCVCVVCVWLCVCVCVK